MTLSFSDKEEDIGEEGEDKDVETAQEKRLRLAKQYLAQLESEGKCLCSLSLGISRGMNRGTQICWSVLFSDQICQSAPIFVQIQICTIWKLWVV